MREFRDALSQTSKTLFVLFVLFLFLIVLSDDFSFVNKDFFFSLTFLLGLTDVLLSRKTFSN